MGSRQKLKSLIYSTVLIEWRLIAWPGDHATRIRTVTAKVGDRACAVDFSYKTNSIALPNI